MSGDGKLEKMEVDYSTTVDEKIPECEQLVKVSIWDYNCDECLVFFCIVMSINVRAGF